MFGVGGRLFSRVHGRREMRQAHHANHLLSLWHLFLFSFQRTAARNLGNMGYHGKSSMYLPSNVLNAAFEMEGLLLSENEGVRVVLGHDRCETVRR